MEPLKYLAGYPEHLQAQVRDLIGQGRLGEILARRYATPNPVRNDAQLYDYVQELKERHMRKAVPLGKVLYDSKLQVMKHALGTHTAISRVMAASSRPVARSASPPCSAMRRRISCG